MDFEIQIMTLDFRILTLYVLPLKILCPYIPLAYSQGAKKNVNKV